MKTRWLVIMVFTLMSCLLACADQTNSNLHVRFAAMTIGGDGKVYLASGVQPDRCAVMRLNRDGSERTEWKGSMFNKNAVANASGMIACAYYSVVILYDNELRQRFVMSDIYAPFHQIQFRSPIRVEAGTSGCFYAADQHAERIVRITPLGKRDALYPIPHGLEAGERGNILEFRVCEPTHRFHVATLGGLIRCFDMNDPVKELWRVKTDIEFGNNELGQSNGGFDVDQRGILHVLERSKPVIKRYDLDGKPLGETALQMGERFKDEDRFFAIRVFGNEILLHRQHDTELFQRYDLTTGKLMNIADIADPNTAARAKDSVKVADAKGCATASDSRPVVRVLYIGNSQLGFLGHSLPGIIDDITIMNRSLPRIDSERVIVGGVGLKELWEQGRARQQIASNKWDCVVIHESVFQENEQQMLQYGKLFGDSIATNGARLVVLATPDVEGKKADHRVMYEQALKLASPYKNARVAGAGMAWFKVWDERPKLDLYRDGDRMHPGTPGYYLDALVLYATLTDKNPEGLYSYLLTEDEAKFLQQVAWRQYQEDRAKEKAQ